MFKRVVWFGSGFTAGMAGGWYVQRTVRQRIERYTPEYIRQDVAVRADAIRTDVVTALSEGREVMRRYRQDAENDLADEQRRRTLRSVSSG
jgi:hypothetical protein